MDQQAAKRSVEAGRLKSMEAMNTFPAKPSEALEQAGRWFAERVSGLDGVQSVGAQARGDEVDLWVIVERMDHDLEGKIFAIESEAIQRFALLLLDTYITPTPGLPQGYVPLYQRKEE
jgi:hypothetical protein